MSFKILIIDDHPETRSIIGHVLKQQGYHVVSAENGQEGLAMAEQEMPHIILCDYMMPILDGVKTVQKLRTNTAFDKVPIIMFTAVDDPQQKLSAFDAGADDYLNKPTDPSELIDRVQVLLETSYGTVPEAAEAGPSLLNPDSLAAKPSLDEPKQGAASQLVAVMGVRGGAGTTTMAINLAAFLAQTGSTTALVDFDMARGHIGLYLNQKITASINTLASLADGEIAGHVNKQLVKYGSNLQLLLTQPNINGRYPTLSDSQAAAVLTALSHTMKTTIVDLGNTFNPIAHCSLELADQVIICLRPERVALIMAKHLLTLLKKLLFPQTTINIVLMDFSSAGIQLPQTAVESFLDEPISASIHISPREIAHSVNKARPLVLINEQTPGRQALIKFAQTLHIPG